MSHQFPRRSCTNWKLIKILNVNFSNVTNRKEIKFERTSCGNEKHQQREKEISQTSGKLFCQTEFRGWLDFHMNRQNHRSLFICSFSWKYFLTIIQFVTRFEDVSGRCFYLCAFPKPWRLRWSRRSSGWWQNVRQLPASNINNAGKLQAWSHHTFKWHRRFHFPRCRVDYGEWSFNLCYATKNLSSLIIHPRLETFMLSTSPLSIPLWVLHAVKPIFLIQHQLQLKKTQKLSHSLCTFINNSIFALI